MDVNEIQIGGTHYRKKYQHWDFVCDTKMPYVLACATKYISRWKDKNGVEDLRKSLHYIQKAEDRGIYMPVNKWWENLIFPVSDFISKSETTEWRIFRCTTEFCKQLETEEWMIIHAIVEGDYKRAIIYINDLIRMEDPAEPDSSYTNQDPIYFKG